MFSEKYEHFIEAIDTKEKYNETVKKYFKLYQLGNIKGLTQEQLKAKINEKVLMEKLNLRLVRIY